MSHKHIPLLILGIIFISSCSILNPAIPTKTDIISTSGSNIQQEVIPKTLDATGTNLSGSILSGSTMNGGLTIATGATYSEEKIPLTKDLCIHDICIDRTHPYFTDGENTVQISWELWEGTGTNYVTQNPGKDENNEYTSPQNAGSSIITIVNTTSELGSKENREDMGGDKTTYNSSIPGLLIKVTRTGGCGLAYMEEFFDTKNIKIQDPSNYFPESLRQIQVGNMTLTMNWGKASEKEMFGLKFQDSENPKKLETISIHDNIEQKILNQMIAESANGTYRYYVLTFKEYPDILLYYKSSLPASDGIITTQFSPSDLDRDGNVINPEKTREILTLYNPTERKIWRGIRKIGDDKNYAGLSLSDFSGSTVPTLFQVKKLDTEHYLLYPGVNYEGFTSAELCKPLVYIYDRLKRENSLSVHFPHGGSFTKLIPDFSQDQTWNFQSDSESKIGVENKSTVYNYLYYSARVPSYVYNTYGWGVYGRDIVAFFEEKLDTIGFNAQEKNDFIKYWKHEFEANTLYFVSFKFDDALDTYVTLDFSEKPIKQMRILLEAYPSSDISSRFVWPQVGKKLDTRLLKHFSRSGEFDVFEWGGTVQKIKNGEINIH